jgi:hypothetical protein
MPDGPGKKMKKIRGCLAEIAKDPEANESDQKDARRGWMESLLRKAAMQ